MKRRELLKGLLALVAGAACLPLTKVLPGRYHQGGIAKSTVTLMGEAGGCTLTVPGSLGLLGCTVEVYQDGEKKLYTITQMRDAHTWDLEEA